MELALFAQIDRQLFWVFLASLFTACLTVFTKRYHGHLSMDEHAGIQKVHTHPTPRVGGIAIGAGALCAYVTTTRGGVNDLLWPLMVAGIPAFLFGLVEDLTKEVSVVARLLATMVSGVVGWAITGYSLTSVNVWGLDYFLGFTFVSVVFTAFAVGGVANSINIIDGFNGLAGGTVIIILGGLAHICFQVADYELMSICLLLIATTLGFFAVNWPWGKLFLGDGGSYFLGFGIAWISVLMLSRHPDMSAWALFTACGYPVMEVGFSVWRRKKRHLNAGDPDRLHMHSLVKRRFIRHFFPGATSRVRNSLTGATMWCAATLPVLVASIFWSNTFALVICFMLLALLYSVVYSRLTQFRWCFPTNLNKLKLFHFG
jgi:UDP-N-acetylmuramyl pentapeptide phosphotransferase/UDP-N-acetylglucosamine-1-phosphate transferase